MKGEQAPREEAFDVSGEHSAVRKVKLERGPASILAELAKLEPVRPLEYDLKSITHLLAYRCRPQSIQDNLGQYQALLVNKSRHDSRITHEWVDGVVHDGVTPAFEIVRGGCANYRIEYDERDVLGEAYIINPEDEHEAFGRLSVLYHELRAPMYCPLQARYARESLQRALAASGGELFTHPVFAEGARRMANTPFGEMPSLYSPGGTAG